MTRRTRRAMTSIELLVVIAIIAILGGLIFAGINAVRGKDAAVQTQADLRNLSTALEKFKTKYGIYPPSRLEVSNVDAAMTGAAAGSNMGITHRLLTRIWPRIKYSEAFGANGMDIMKAPATIEGDQCLVLFLGGRHGMDANSEKFCQGFSMDPENPLKAMSPSDGVREKPLFEFAAARLHNRTSSKPFYSYGDGWFDRRREDTGKPLYAYFAPREGKYEWADCATLLDSNGNYPCPYRNPNIEDALKRATPLNANTFQILSSGADMRWGASEAAPAAYPAGTQLFLWAPNNTSWLGGATDRLPHADNMANFAPGRLESGNSGN